MSVDIVESFDLKDIDIPKNTPSKTKNEIIASFSAAGWSNNRISSVINSLTKKKLGFSYRFRYKSEDYLLYELYDKSIKEYHFFNLNRPDESAEDINNLSNSTQVFSMIFNLIYKDIKEGNFKHGIRISSNESRNRLYRKIFDKVNVKYGLNLLLKDIKKDSFIIDIPRHKNFKESIRLK